MDKLHILERINEYDGENVHVLTHSGKSYTGQLNIITWGDAGLDLYRRLEIGWRQDVVDVNDILEIRPT